MKYDINNGELNNDKISIDENSEWDKKMCWSNDAWILEIDQLG